MPAILLDTSTGCLERFVKLTAIDNPKQVWWVREYMDGVLPDVTNGKAVPDSGPPARCANEKPTRVIKYDARGNRIPDNGVVPPASGKVGN
jgi:hypothetical protein